jgi:outer membrane protein OmpA-like peptidoglycan-associated protein
MEVLLFGAFLAFVVATHQAPEPAPVPPEPDRAILLPDPDGQVGRLTITTTAGTQEIAQAFGAVAATPEGQLSAYAETPDSVKARHASLLDVQPPPPRSYLLYFVSGSNELVPESRATLEALKRDAETRPAAEIRVIGHTDTVGAADTNEALSLRRAEAIVQALRDFGIRPQSFEAVGRGEMDPLVPTPDATAEPRNRRVEVSIR